MKIILLKSFLRSKASLSGLCILLLLGIISLNIGKNFLKKHTKLVNHTAVYQENKIKKHIKNASDDLGLLLYYAQFGLVNQMPHLAGLSIGVRDINPTTQSVSIRNLEEQKYASELINPYYQLLGKMDLSFVFIYFFPLIIITLCFSIISEEKESGRWKMIVMQSSNFLKVIRFKFLIHYVFILIITLMLLLIGGLYLSIPLSLAFGIHSILSVFYITFWFALCWLVISFNKGSNTNLLSLLFLWVTLCLIAPAIIKSVTIILFPLHETYDTMIESREGYHKK